MPVSAPEDPGLPVPDVDVVVVVHADNPTASVTRRELANIYSKKLTEWGPGRPIQPFDQKSSSDVRKAFSHADADVIDYVRQIPGAVGYVSADARLGEGVKALQVTDR